MDAEQEKRFRFRARLEAELAAKASPDSSVISDTRDLINTPAEMLRNNPQAQQAAVDKAQQKAYADQPFTGKAVAGVGRKLYGTIPGVANKDELALFDKASRGDIATALGSGATDAALGLAGGRALGGALKVGEIASPLLRSLASGAAYGAPSTALHQSQNLAEGKGFDPVGAAVEMGLSAGLPVAGNQLGKLGVNKGVQIAQTALKSNAKIAGEKILSPDQAKVFLSKWGSLKGLKSSEDLISKTHDALNQSFDDLINQAAAGKSVNLRGSLAVAQQEIDKLAADAKINLSQVPAIKATLNGFKEDIKGITNKAGWSKFPTAQGFKSKTLDDVANYAKKNPGQFSEDLDAKAIAARTYRKALANQMAHVEPKLKPLNQQFQQMAQVEPFIDNAIARGQGNRGLSMQDIAALSAGSLGAVGATASDHTKLAPLAILPFLLSRGQKSTGLATALFQGGNSLGQQSNTRDLLMQLLRSGYNQGTK